MSKEQQNIINLLNEYASAVNNKNNTALSDLYCEAGIFMPNGYSSIPGKRNIKNAGKKHFTDKGVHIVFVLQDIRYHENTAWVNAHATVSIEDLKTQETELKTTRDLFLLVKEKQVWKIAQYIFNTSSERSEKP